MATGCDTCKISYLMLVMSVVMCGLDKVSIIWALGFDVAVLNSEGVCIMYIHVWYQ